MDINTSHISVVRQAVAFFRAAETDLEKRVARNALKELGYTPESASQLVNNGDREDV